MIRAQKNLRYIFHETSGNILTINLAKYMAKSLWLANV
jgi:hypothetical protein